MAEPDQFQESRYSLRVNLRQKSEKIPERPKKSAKDYYEEYRKRLKSETARLQEARLYEEKKYRRSLTGEKKKSYNEKSKLRMRAYRQRLKTKASVDKPSTRHKVAKLREYWRLKKREERGSLTVFPKPSRQKESENNNDIKLAYIAIPGVYEHYDACVESLPTQEVFTATKFHDATCDETECHHIEDEQIPEVQLPSNKINSKTITTPKKKAKKLLTRKRKATPHNWKKNVRKQLRLSGEQYTTSEGKRQQLFESFWALGNYERQKDYVCARIDEVNTRTYLDDEGKAKSKRKQVARKFSLEVDDTRHQICKSFFMKTFCAYIDHAMKSKKGGHFTGKDLRGKHDPHNKLDIEQITYAKRHIETFPKVSGHYVRKETNRQFLGPELTLP
ncbi:LOW QUALITY PROTEIN: hypothetical protein MAR_027317 [Mya arenaria]|uniref:Uncharacterized protein n=1 Tax=Mya arenaria TaxID=6604 RepID=A0ABY7EW54_MYAAR|nr:LOW QUALITY PROTEIN: hypothetical protein MAR_027317 [Mya arenaria]